MPDAGCRLVVAVEARFEEPRRIPAPGMEKPATDGALPRIAFARDGWKARVVDGIALALVTDLPIACPLPECLFVRDDFDRLDVRRRLKHEQCGQQLVDLGTGPRKIIEEHSMCFRILLRACEVGSQCLTDGKFVDPAESFAAGGGRSQNVGRDVLSQPKNLPSW
ncbi:hypothetical protein A5780_08760 [Nocardia sp. 852002-20019_SCH5090214]|nr:hypothetical protein A5780_08760 [Nocardia sp. 852002-20019_SCH5090214]